MTGQGPKNKGQKEGKVKPRTDRLKACLQTYIRPPEISDKGEGGALELIGCLPKGRERKLFKPGERVAEERACRDTTHMPRRGQLPPKVWWGR